MRFGIVEDRLQRAAHRTLDIDGVLQPRLREGLQFGPRLFGEGEKAGLLVGEMQVERAVAEPGLARNILRAGGMIATLDEQLARRSEQPRARVLWASGARRAVRLDERKNGHC